MDAALYSRGCKTKMMAPCKYCSSSDLLEINVQKAYRTGGTVYKPSNSNGDYWTLDEFNLEQELTGIIDGGDIEITVCLDCHRIQGFEITPEEKQKLIKQHVNRGNNPLRRAREKKAEQAVRKQERESRQHLYDEWSKDQPKKTRSPGPNGSDIWKE